MKWTGIAVLAAVAIACGGSAPDATDEAAEPAAVATAAPGVVDIRAEDYAFTAPPTFPSGWVSLRLMNEGEEPHFVSIIE
ncbi:MAG: hypothetical protein R3190_13390, partial [Thermoanaerobaculia bacterium]|nr:hypothetical protein [Thermoanaerobaculia bacterium]